MLHLWRLSRPEIWIATLFPMYVGFVLASHALVPGFASWLAFWAGAAQHGATTDMFLSTTWAWLGVAGPFLITCFVMGPLLWTATLLINDVHDLPGDRENPRKARSPLVQGLASPRWARRTAYACAALAVIASVAVNAVLVAVAAVSVLLAWLYSVPPARLKTRPGADVAVNAAAGVLSGLAGWSLASPLSSVPWWLMPQAILVGAAIYIPTTLVDFAADAKAGYRTFATRFGRAAAFRAGFACWVLANLGALGLSWESLFIPRAMFPFLVIFTPLLVYEYATFIGKARAPEDIVKGIALSKFTFLAVNAVFALMYTGLWRT
ncbi:MAG: UbiA family prenyltransferase [Thermoplasmatota archaeon]